MGPPMRAAALSRAKSKTKWIASSRLLMTRKQDRSKDQLSARHKNTRTIPSMKSLSRWLTTTWRWIISWLALSGPTPTRTPTSASMMPWARLTAHPTSTTSCSTLRNLWRTELRRLTFSLIWTSQVRLQAPTPTLCQIATTFCTVSTRWRAPAMSHSIKVGVTSS